MNLLKPNRKIFAVLVCLVLGLMLCGCTEKVEFSQEKIPVDVTELSMVLQPGETVLLDKLTVLQRADLRGSENYAEIMDWAAAHPEVDVLYSVAFPEGSVVENTAVSLDLSGLNAADVPAAVELMGYLPELKELKLLPGVFSPAEVMSLTSAVEGLAFEYSYQLDGREIDHYAESLDLTGISSAAVTEALALLPNLPELKSVELGNSNETKLSWDELYALISACPELDFDYAFTVYGQIFDLDSTVMDLNHRELPDNGAEAYQAARCMKKLELLDMDFCGVPNEVMEQIRDGLPGVKVVWRIWFGNNYSVRTDVEKILASKPSVGGALRDADVQVLKYCTDVKYIDLGHNEVITDISFVSHMPRLEVAIFAMNDIVDISPLANCPELEYLEIQTNNRLADISPLAACTKLRHLNTAHCREISDISALYGLDELERFWLGASNGVPQEQKDEFRRLHPDCELDDMVFSDPTSDGWRIVDMKIDAWIPIYHPRYEILLEQFGYLTEDYSFSWKDPKYNGEG